MSKLNKSYFATLKRQKVAFRVVNSSPDIKVQIVSSGADYKFKRSTSSSMVKQTIAVQIVTGSADMKLQEVSSGADFEVYFK